MSQESNFGRDPDYYAARAVEERRLAMASADPKVRAIHLEMAERYSQLAASGGQDAPEIIGDGQQTA